MEGRTKSVGGRSSAESASLPALRLCISPRLSHHQIAMIGSKGKSFEGLRPIIRVLAEVHRMEQLHEQFQISCDVLRTSQELTANCQYDYTPPIPAESRKMYRHAISPRH